MFFCCFASIRSTGKKIYVLKTIADATKTKLFRGFNFQIARTSRTGEPRVYRWAWYDQDWLEEMTKEYKREARLERERGRKMIYPVQINPTLIYDPNKFIKFDFEAIDPNDPERVLIA